MKYQLDTEELEELSIRYEPSLSKRGFLLETVKFLNLKSSLGEYKCELVLDLINKLFLDYSNEENYLDSPWYIIVFSNDDLIMWQDVLKRLYNYNTPFFEDVYIIHADNLFNTLEVNSTHYNINFIFDINSSFNYKKFAEINHTIELSECILLFNETSLIYFDRIQFLYSNFEFLNLNDIWDKKSTITNYSKTDIYIISTPFSKNKKNEYRTPYFKTKGNSILNIISKCKGIHRKFGDINIEKIKTTSINFIGNKYQTYLLILDKINTIKRKLKRVRENDNSEENNKYLIKEIKDYLKELLLVKRDFLLDHKYIEFLEILAYIGKYYKVVSVAGKLSTLKANKKSSKNNDEFGTSLKNWRNLLYGEYIIVHDPHLLKIKDMDETHITVFSELDTNTLDHIKYVTKNTTYNKIIVLYNPDVETDGEIVEQIIKKYPNFKNYDKENFIRIFR